MAATRTLLAKELRQHAGALAGVSVLLGVAWLIGNASQGQEARTLTTLEVLPGFLRGPLLAAALYLGHRLVVAEHHGRTQRFVEALPVRRWHMGVVKAGFGLFWLTCWALLALAASAALAAGAGEPLDRRFLGILAARLAGYVFALWGVVFALGYFGRLRLALAAVLVAALYLFDHHTAWELSRFGPFALVAPDTLPLERRILPLAALVEAAAVGAAGFAVAHLLARVREGSVVEALARPISAREVAALVIVAFGAATGFAALDRDTGAKPYALTTSKLVRRDAGGVPVEIAYFEDELRPSAERLAAELAPVLAALGGPGGLNVPLVPVRLVHAPELRVDRPRTVQVHHQHGIVGRVNLEALAGEPSTDTVAFVLHDVMRARLRGRAGVESRHWLLDGFALHFALHGRSAAPPLDAPEPDPWLLRAVVAAETVPLDGRALAEHWTISEQLGSTLASALAASGWRLLEARAGRAAVLALARATLARQGTNDVRDVLHDRRNPLPEVFARTTGLSWTSFLQAWGDELRAARRRAPVATRLAAAPRPRLSVRATAETLAVQGTVEPPPPGPLSCLLLHRKLPPYDAPLDPHELEEVPLAWPAGARALEVSIASEYGAGERAFVAVECEAAPLRAPVRLLAQRVTIE